MTPSAADARAAAETAARDAYGRLLARLVRRTRDIAAAEDALSDAFAKALAVWPETGVPAAPEAWLTTVATNAARDAARRRATGDGAIPTLQLLAEEISARDPVADERLTLILAASHPAIATAVHAPLILQVVFGVPVHEIAPAFLMAPSALGQRLVRAKAKIKNAGIRLDVGAHERPARLARALDAVYALYTVARAAPPSATAEARAGDALTLALLIADLARDEPEAFGLVSLIAFSESRRPAARVDGAYVPLSKQDCALWDARLLALAEGQLARAARHRVAGPYQLEAAIQSVHCNRRRTGATEWAVIATLYDARVAMAPSVGAEVARAVAHAEAFGPAQGLALLAEISGEKAERYQPYWAVRAHLEAASGQESSQAADRAIEMTGDEAVRSHLKAQR
ncbi:MAG: DUF6596 domain-containing protein [Pseudomonadota bacterium]